MNKTEMTDEEIKGKILHKFMRYGKIKASHTHIDNVPKGFPKHIRGRVKEIGKEMIRERLLIPKTTHQGIHVSVNYAENMKSEILRLIKIFLESDKAGF